MEPGYRSAGATGLNRAAAAVNPRHIVCFVNRDDLNRVGAVRPRKHAEAKG